MGSCFIARLSGLRACRDGVHCKAMRLLNVLLILCSTSGCLVQNWCSVFLLPHKWCVLDGLSGGAEDSVDAIRERVVSCDVLLILNRAIWHCPLPRLCCCIGSAATVAACLG